MNLYEILEVSKTASQNEIKKAYRKMAQIKHPDHGGDENEFKQLVLAYSILSNDEKRHRYDNGESAENLSRHSSGENDALKMVIEVFLQLVMRAPSVSNLNLFDAVRSSVKETLRGIDQDKVKITKVIERLNNVKKRVVAKGKDNVFSQALDAQISKANQDINALDRSYKIGVDGLKILEDYDYDFEAVQTLFNGNFNITISQVYGDRGMNDDINR